MKARLLSLKQRMLALPPRYQRAGGILGVASVLLVSSVAFGLFDAGYDIDGSYNNLYPSGTPRPTATPPTSLQPPQPVDGWALT